MKKLILCLFLIGLLFIVSCNDNPEPPEPLEDTYYTVSFVDGDGKVLKEVRVLEGEAVTMPELEAPKGYCYEPDYSEDEASLIIEDKTLKVKLKELKKSLEFYIDDEQVESCNVRFSVEYLPEVRREDIDISTAKWVLTTEEYIEKSKIYYYRYDLEYKPKEFYNVIFYDGENVLNLSPATHSIYKETVLPTISKEGYIFAGWYLSDISLAKQEKIEEGIKSDVHLHARWVESSSHEGLHLDSNAKAHIDRIDTSFLDYNLMYVVGLPSGLLYTNLSSYKWSTNDEKVARISEWGSITVCSSGYAIVTGVCKTDPSYKIDGIIKVGFDGVSISNETEANTFDMVKVTFKDDVGNIIEETNVRKGGAVTALPTPPIYKDKAFVGWDHDNFNILSDTIFTAKYSSTAKNTYTGKTISFVGDSLTSYWGWIPEKFASTLNCPYADVNDPNQTWWMRTVNAVGGKMFINNGYGGTCVGGGTEPTATVSRLKHLVVDNQYADVTMLYIGSNDCAAHEKETAKDMYTIEFFEKSYRQMLDNIKVLCPDTEIVMISLAKSKMYTEESKNLYNGVITKLAKEYNIRLIDISTLDITGLDENGNHYVIDIGHPNNAGNQKIAEAVINGIFYK